MQLLLRTSPKIILDAVDGVHRVIEQVVFLLICNDLYIAVLVSEYVVLFHSLCCNFVDMCAGDDEISQLKRVNEVCSSS